MNLIISLIKQYRKRLRQEMVNFKEAKHYIYDYYSIDKCIHKINGNSELFHKKWQTFDGLMEIKSLELLRKLL